MKQIVGVLAVMLALAGAVVWAEVSPGSRVVPIADKTVTSATTAIVSANQNRLALSCTNTSASVNVRWGSASAASTTGQRIAAGAAVEIRNTAAIYMISEGASVTVSCTEELR
jgi:hypothetical protein